MFEAAESGQRFATRAMICLSRGGQDAFEAGLTGHLSVIWFIEGFRTVFRNTNLGPKTSLSAWSSTTALASISSWPLTD